MPTFRFLFCKSFNGFHKSKHNNKFNIVINFTRWTFTKLKIFDFLFLPKNPCADVSNMIHQAFVEHWFVHLSVIIVLQCNICFEIQSFGHKTKHLNINLHRHYFEIQSDIWYLYHVLLVSTLLYCYKDLNFTSYQNLILLLGHINNYMLLTFFVWDQYSYYFIAQYMDHKSLMYQILCKKICICKLFCAWFTFIFCFKVI